MKRKRARQPIGSSPVDIFSYNFEQGDIMAPLLRRRLVCFYCGCRSTKKYNGGFQKWECETCEAVNHLDEVCLPQLRVCEHPTDGFI